jgi:hypothetical protein
MVNLVYFDKLLQIPIITLRNVYRTDYKKVFEGIMESARNRNEFPVFFEILEFFESHAREMQNGAEELAHSKEWLDIWWYPDEYIFIKLVRENKFDDFYKEAEKILERSMVCKSISCDILREAMLLNRLLIKQPFQTSNLELALSYNIWELYKAVLCGSTVPIMPGEYKYTIDRTTKDARGANWWGSWEDWYEKMVFYCNRRGAYLYGNVNPHQEIPGIH